MTTYHPTTDSPDDRVITEGPNAWFADHGNLVTLVYWMAEQGCSPTDIAHAVEKCWHYTAEYIAAVHDFDHYGLTVLLEEDDDIDTLESRIIALQSVETVTE